MSVNWMAEMLNSRSSAITAVQLLFCVGQQWARYLPFSEK